MKQNCNVLVTSLDSVLHWLCKEIWSFGQYLFKAWVSFSEKKSVSFKIHVFVHSLVDVDM